MQSYEAQSQPIQIQYNSDSYRSGITVEEVAERF